MDTFLENLIDWYPEQGERIVVQFREDPVFRSICEEMEIAEQAIIRWKNLPPRAAEYEQILNELKIEFRAYLTSDCHRQTKDNQGSSAASDGE